MISDKMIFDKEPTAAERARWAAADKCRATHQRKRNETYAAAMERKGGRAKFEAECRAFAEEIAIAPPEAMSALGSEYLFFKHGELASMLRHLGIIFPIGNGRGS
jgi:hypothetical protein